QKVYSSSFRDHSIAQFGADVSRGSVRPGRMVSGVSERLQGETIDGDKHNFTSGNPFAGPVAGRAEGTSGAREGPYQALRPRECRAAPASHGEDRKELCLRRPAWHSEPQGPLRGSQATHRLSLHVR